MTSSRRSKWAAVCVFTLIALAVLGGMSWATLVTYRLAEFDIREDRQREVRRAVSFLDNYVRLMLQPEMVRPYGDYANRPYAIATFDESGRLLHTQRAILDSPIAINGPSQDWIELYFQVDEGGRWTSPQELTDERAYYVDGAALSQEKVRRGLERLQAELPLTKLVERVAQSAARDRLLQEEENPGGGTELAPTISERIALASDTRRSAERGAASAKRPPRNVLRLRSLASSQCVLPDIAEYRVDATDPDALESPGDSSYASVGTSPHSIATFWLTSQSPEEPKLTLVRSAHSDEKLVYQGFLCNWAGLNARLMEKLSADFPQFSEARLEPVIREVDEVPAEQEHDTELTVVPVRLNVPESELSTAQQAWDEVDGLLFSAWLGAVAVLAIAGWGVRNLVALTERRMQFAYAVTHELRTPLTTFRLYSDMLAAGMVPSESRQEYLETLNRESVRLTSLVESVLEFARLENQRVRLNPARTDGAGIAARLAETLDARCRAVGIEAVLINSIAADCVLHVDLGVIDQIAGVLINNACRHARSAQTPKVIVQLGLEGDRLMVDVIDTGSGVERGDMRAIFKPFRRGRSADATAQGGIGLGLALARNWAGLLNGHLELAARHHHQHGGAHFRLTIPVEVPEKTG